MVGIILASHGGLAKSMMESAAMVFGDQTDVVAAELTCGMGPDDFKQQLEAAVASLTQQDQVLFLVDLWGGTPFNQVSGLLADKAPAWVVVTGANLPMLIEAYTLRMKEGVTAAEIAAHIFREGRKGVRIQPESLQPKGSSVKGSPPAGVSQGASIPEGTVLGDGHIKLVLCRVDSRLLHGQVAMAWSKAVTPDRILVVSDGVARDKLRKTMIAQASPPGIKSTVIPVSKLIEISKDPRFGATRAMLLFETPQDVLRAVEGGVDIKTVNLGGMAGSAGKATVGALSMDQDDVETLENLASRGIEFDIRQVPSYTPVSFDSVIKKIKTDLGL